MTREKRDTVLVNFRIPKEDHEKLKEYSRWLRRNISDIMRDALFQYMDSVSPLVAKRYKEHAIEEMKRMGEYNWEQEEKSRALESEELEEVKRQRQYELEELIDFGEKDKHLKKEDDE